MLKLSILLSKLDFSTMGDLRADLVGEAERLEAIEETFLAINKECGKADAAPVKERKPLIGIYPNYSLYALIDDYGSELLDFTNSPVKAGKWRANGHRVAQVMAPDESGNCPTQYIDGVQLDCEIEWAIYGTGGNVWLSLQGGEYAWRDTVYHAKRFASKQEAKSYIAVNHIAAAIPFPVPKLREAK